MTDKQIVYQAERPSAIDRWANETTVTLQRFEFERTVRNMDRISALRLIRAAYNAPLAEAKIIHSNIMKMS